LSNQNWGSCRGIKKIPPNWMENKNSK
jgi:hypothetical protein